MGLGVLPQSRSHLAGYGFVVALPQEARILSRRLPGRGGVVALEASRWLGVSGMGAGKAERMALRLLDEGALGLVSWGTCGGLAPGLEAGSLILASSIRRSDGASYQVSLPPSAVQHALPVGQVHTGILLSVSQPVTTVHEKGRLYRDYGALAVDMESAEIAAVAVRHGVPFVAVRAVVDPGQDALPEWLAAAVDEWGRVRVAALLAGLGVRVAAWGELIRLGRQFGKASRTLKSAALALGLRPGGSSGDGL